MKFLKKGSGLFLKQFMLGIFFLLLFGGVVRAGDQDPEPEDTCQAKLDSCLADAVAQMKQDSHAVEGRKLSCYFWNQKPRKVCDSIYEAEMAEVMAKFSADSAACAAAHDSCGVDEEESYKRKNSLIRRVVKVFPNPSSGSFMVEVNESIASVNVLDYLGRVKKRLFISGISVLEVSLGEPGIYFVEATSKSGMRVRQKIVVR